MKYLKNKKGSISLFVLLSLLFFLVLVSSISVSRKNKETTINQQYRIVKQNYEREIGTEEQIYARKENKCILVIDPNGGSYNNSTSTTSISQKNGTTYQLENPTAPSITFDADGGVLGEIEGNISFERWILSGDGTLNENIYIFGKSRATVTAKYNKNSIKLPTVTKSGFTFTGWYDTNETKAGNAGEDYSPKGAITLKAKWTELDKNEVVLAFKDSEGTQYGNPNSLVLHEGETATVRAPTIRKYGDWTSLYWTKGTDANSSKDVESGAEIENVDMNSSANYYARYEKEITVSFNINGLEGETPSNQKGKIQVNASNLENIKGLEITLPTIANVDGHNINGWNTKEDGTGISYNFDEKKEFKDNTTLYAQWHENSYTVKFDANGGEGTMADQSFTYGTAQNLTANTYTRTGYTFTGWNTKFDGSGTSYTDRHEVNNLTTENNGQVKLYAQWTAHEYDVYFSPNRATLPSGYTELDYIESDGGQHIVTDYVPNDETGVSIRFAPKDLNSNDRVFFGTGNTDSAGYWFGARKKGYYRWNTLYSGANGKTRYITLNVDEIAEIRMNYLNNRGLELNGTTYFNGLPTLEEKTLPFAIFGYNNDVNNEVTLNAKMRFYGMEVTQGSNLEAHYVPCYRNSDGKAGVYDVVGNTFYTNEGTGEFTKGFVTQHFVYGTAQNLTANTYTNSGRDFSKWSLSPDGTGTEYTDKQSANNLSPVSGDTVVLYAQWTSSKMTINMYPNRLAPGYVELDYIEGTGTQYITTDVIPTNTTGAQLKMTNTDSSSNLVYFGCGTAQNDGFWIGNSGGKFYARFDTLYSNGSGNMSTTPNMSNNVNYTFTLNYLNDRKLKRDSTTFVNNLPTLGSKTSPIYIFGYYNPNDDIVHIPGKYKLYEFRISEGSDIIRNYVPCYRISDGVAGLYETYNGVFYPSESADAFVGGNEVKTTQEIYYGHSDNLEANTYTKEGYTFANWNTESDGSGTTYTNEQLINNTNPSSETVKLYAQWVNPSLTLLQGIDFNSAIKGESYTEGVNPETGETYKEAAYDESIIEIYFGDIEEEEKELAEEVIPVDVNRAGSINAYKMPLDGEEDEGLYYVVVTAENGGTICASQDSSQMFDNFASVDLIDVSGIDFSNTTNMSMMFLNCTSLHNIDFGEIDTSNVTNMSSMFEEVSLISNIDVSGFDTSHVTDMSYMFSNMQALEEIDVSEFNTSNVTNMSGMFIGCAGLYDLDVSNFDTTRVTSMNSMFSDLSITELNLSSFDTSNVTDMSYMFANSANIETIYVSLDFNQNSLENGEEMFNGCENLVGGNETAYDSNNIDESRAYVDTESQPGYFTLYTSIRIVPSTLMPTTEPIIATIDYRPGIVSGFKAGFGTSLLDAQTNASSATAYSVTITDNGYVYAEGIDLNGNTVTASLQITNILETPSLRGTGTEIESYVDANPGDIPNLEEDDTPDTNLRFVGNSPDNYVKLTVDGQEELWRIIGIFDGKIKIMKADTISGYAFDNNNVADWNTSTLKTYLNTTYYNSIDDANLVETNSTWYLGTATSGLNVKYTRLTAYNSERDSTKVASGRAATTTAPIGLMYVSDFGYATKNSANDADTLMNKYNEISKGYNWIGANREWTIDTNQSATSTKTTIVSDYKLFLQNANDVTDVAFRPCLFLKSNVEIYDGKGTIAKPYEIRTSVNTGN